jgi:hypothetical protein
MDEESNDNIESINDETEEVLNTEEVEETVVDTETEDDSLIDRLAKVEETNKRLFERAKKAEAEAKEWKAKGQPAEAQTNSSEKQDGLSSMDTIALIDAKVTNREDIETVQKYARLEGISIGDALSASVVKAILKDKAESRQTAEATNSGPARRGSSKPSLDAVLEGTLTGKLPDDPELLAEARMNAKFKKNQ